MRIALAEGRETSLTGHKVICATYCISLAPPRKKRMRVTYNAHEITLTRIGILACMYTNEIHYNENVRK